MERVGAALGHGGDLQSARSAVLRLVALREDFHLTDRLDVQVDHLAVVAGVHGRDAVHHDVVLADAAQTGAAGGGAAPPLTPGTKATRLVKFPRTTGRLSTCFGWTANERSPLCVCTSATSAVTVTVSAVPPTSSVIGGTPTRSPPLTTIPVRRKVLKAGAVTSTVYVSGGHVREHVVAAVVGEDRGAPRAARLADEDHARTGDDASG